MPRLKRAPAAKMMHHAFLGGLLEHVVSLCDLCRWSPQHYRELDADLLLTGAILHDIGKLDELCYERSIQLHRPRANCSGTSFSSSSRSPRRWTRSKDFRPT